MEYALPLKEIKSVIQRQKSKQKLPGPGLGEERPGEEGQRAAGVRAQLFEVSDKVLAALATKTAEEVKDR